MNNNFPMPNGKSVRRAVVGIVLAAALVFVGANSLHAVPAGHTGVVTRFGAVTMLRAGLLLCVGGGLILTVAALADAPWYLIVACILLATSPVGFIMGNATALATGIRRELAGSISAVMGFVQSLLGGIVSPLMGLGSQPTHTMAFGILTCGIIAAAAGLWATSRLAREAG